MIYVKILAMVHLWTWPPMALEFFHVCLTWAIYDCDKNSRKNFRIIGGQIYESTTLCFWHRSHCKNQICAIHNRSQEKTPKNYTARNKPPYTKTGKNHQKWTKLFLWQYKRPLLVQYLEKCQLQREQKLLDCEEPFHEYQPYHKEKAFLSVLRAF